MRSEFNYLASLWKKLLIRKRGGMPRRTTLPPTVNNLAGCNSNNRNYISLGPKLSCNLSDNAKNILIAQQKTDYYISHAMFIIRTKNDVFNFFTAYDK